MKLTLGTSILSIKDVRYATINSVNVNEDEWVSVKVEYDPDWGWWPKLKFKLKTWMHGSVYGSERLDPSYHYKLTIDYITEEGSYATWWCQSENEASIRALFEELKAALPHLKLKEINEAILSE